MDYPPGFIKRIDDQMKRNKKAHAKAEPQDRRQQQQPVAVERRSGQDRRRKR